MRGWPMRRAIDWWIAFQRDQVFIVYYCDTTTARRRSSWWWWWSRWWWWWWWRNGETRKRSEGVGARFRARSKDPARYSFSYIRYNLCIYMHVDSKLFGNVCTASWIIRRLMARATAAATDGLGSDKKRPAISWCPLFFLRLSFLASSWLVIFYIFYRGGALIRAAAVNGFVKVAVVSAAQRLDR